MTGIPVYDDLSSASYFYTVCDYWIVYYTLRYNLCEAHTESILLALITIRPKCTRFILEFDPIRLVWVIGVPYPQHYISLREGESKTDLKRKKYQERLYMHQRRASRYQATSASESAADAKRTSQCILSRYGETLSSENADHSERMIQQRAPRNEATRASENVADAERSFSSWIFQNCGHTHNSV